MKSSGKEERYRLLRALETVCIISCELKWVKDVGWGLSSIGPLVFVREHWDLLEWTQMCNMFVAPDQTYRYVHGCAD